MINKHKLTSKDLEIRELAARSKKILQEVALILTEKGDKPDNYSDEEAQMITKKMAQVEEIVKTAVEIQKSESFT